MAKNRTYTDIEKAQALAAFAAEGNNASRASRVTGIPRKTIAQWANGSVGVKSIENLPVLVDGEKLKLVDKLDDIAHAIADAMPSKIEKASLRDSAISLGVAIDKRNLLRGQPTSITQTTLSDRAKLEVAISQLVEELRSKGEIIDRGEAIRLLKPYLGSEIAKAGIEAPSLEERPLQSPPA